MRRCTLAAGAKDLKPTNKCTKWAGKGRCSSKEVATKCPRTCAETNGQAVEASSCVASGVTEVAPLAEITIDCFDSAPIDGGKMDTWCAKKLQKGKCYKKKVASYCQKTCGSCL